MFLDAVHHYNRGKCPLPVSLPVAVTHRGRRASINKQDTRDQRDAELEALFQSALNGTEFVI